MLQLAIAFVVVLLGYSSALADKRVALVIGNGDYAKVPRLANPGRDADAVERLLRAAGFDVVEVKNDLGAAAMRRALRDFSDRVRDADIAVVFYAGHGIEVNGANYLIPVDAVLERDIDVEDEAIPLDRVTQILDQAKRLRLVILDACRDNPFLRSMRRTLTNRSIGRGLARIEVSSSDTLIAFAAKAGSTAADGEGANSPYTAALVKHLTTPGLDLRLAFGRVRDEVLKSTRNRQEPFLYGSLGGAEIALVPMARLEALTKDAADAWAAAKDINSIAVLEAFTARYDGTFYADLARARAQDLKRVAETTAQAAREAAERQTMKAAEAQRQAELQRADEQRRTEEARREADRLAAAKPPEPAARVANLPEVTAPPSAQQPPADAKSLARSLQTELKRVGCDPGATNGVWGTQAKEALAKFSRLSKVTLSVDEPTTVALQALTGQKGRVCPLTCAAGETEVKGRCVVQGAAKPPSEKPPASSRKASSKDDEPKNTKLCAAGVYGQVIGPCTGRSGERPLN